MDIVEGSSPSEAEKEAPHRVRTGDVGALATPGVMAHHGKEKNKENLWMLVRTCINWNRSGQAGPKEVAVVAIGEHSQQRKTEQLAGR
jgi:hypothetical protein